MKVRSDIFSSRRAVLLSGAMLVAMLPAFTAMAADQLPVKAVAVEDQSGWTSSGTIEAGVNIFLKKPGNGFGKTSTDPFWLTPSTTDSNAKMDEYGKVPRGLFLDEIGVHADRKDGRFSVDIWADNVGMDNQRYLLNLYEPGRQYFSLGWDQTPHLLSSSAKSIFGGVGTNHLTVDSTTRTTLQSNLGPATQTQAQRNAIENYIDNRAPMNNLELKTLREKASIAYRNTMLDNWDFNVDYSNEHRTGNRPLGIGYAYTQTTAAGVPAAPRPSTGAIEVPQPVDDRTQNANGAGEFSGTTPWGTRWNTSVKYAGSFYNNNMSSFTVDNPFCITCVAANNTSVASGTQIGANTLLYGLAPSNNANGLTWNTALDLPMKSRYVSTVQYTQFRQNETFLNDATNGITTMAPYPAASLNGAINAFLTNNVLSTHITSDLTNTARVRYYDRKDTTPTLAFANYVYADNGTATTASITRSPQSYSKMNLGDDLKWQANRVWTFGTGYFFERYVFENGEVDATNESGAKAFVDIKPWSWATARNSVEYSQRRYNTYLAANGTDAAANAMRYFFVQNRNRTKETSIIEMEIYKNVTLSPNGGLRWDEYPTDATINAINLKSNSLGTRFDRSWNAGSDLSVRVTPDFRVTVGYNHEEHYLTLQTCCGGAAGGYTDANLWSSNITQRYNTYMISSDWKAIPGKLDFKLEYLAAVSNEANLTNFCSSGATNCTGLNAGQTGPIQFPDEHNRFLRFSVLAKYYFDPTYVRQMGWNGQVTAKLRYAWEQNRNTNWATDNFSPYSPSAADAGGNDITNGGRSLFLAYNNPNYTAQIITAAIAWNW